MRVGKNTGYAIWMHRRRFPDCAGIKRNPYYILDFYAPSLKLCLELDGRTHDGEAAQAYDAERTRMLAAAGITVIRFSNAGVMGDFEAVCGAIVRACKTGTPH